MQPETFIGCGGDPFARLWIDEEVVAPLEMGIQRPVRREVLQVIFEPKLFVATVHGVTSLR